MNNESDDNRLTNIGDDIVKSFHEQFAQNQNHHQNLFIQILAILLSVLIGYGYLYIRVDAPDKDLKVPIDTLYVYLAIATYLLSMAIALIANMSLGFRRDQLMAANIRVKSGVMTLESNDNYFFGSFNPQKNTNVLTWMPEFHKIFFIGLFIIKFLMLWATIKYQGYELGCFILDYPRFINTAILSVLLDFIVYIYFWWKWVKHADCAPQRLKSND